MKNHGLRRIFSLFLALFMVFTLLPTTALAEDTTGADETQPKTVVEEQQDVPPVEDGKKEDEEKEDEVEKKLDEIPVDPKQDAPSVQGLNGVESDVEPLALNVGHTLKVRFQVLYLDDALYTGYNYGHCRVHNVCLPIQNSTQ